MHMVPFISSVSIIAPVLFLLEHENAGEAGRRTPSQMEEKGGRVSVFSRKCLSQSGGHRGGFSGDAAILPVD